MSEKEETVTITRHFTVDMEKYAAARKAEASIQDDAEGVDESGELDEAEARRIAKRLLVEKPRNEYNATVKMYGLRKLPIELDSLSCPAPGTAEGCYPAWFWGCVDDLGKVESIVANRDVHDEVERYWLKTTTGTYLIDLGCDTAFACSGFVRVALPLCANAYAYYFDPRITAAFINANRGEFRRLNAPAKSEIPSSGLEIPTEKEAWRIIAETAADWGVNSRDWEHFGVVTATTWVNKDGELLYDPAKGDYRLDSRIMRLENRIMMLNSCCWLSDLVSTGERCLKMASLAQDFARQREPHYRRLAEWIEKEVTPRAKAALPNLEKACWRDVCKALWNGDVLAKFVPKPKAGMDQTNWQCYADELRKLTAPIVEGYERQLKKYKLINGSDENGHFDVIEAVEKWMRSAPCQVPTGMQPLPLKCDPNNCDNPYFGKDEDMNAIWLLEFYYCEDVSFCLLEAKAELDQGRCAPAILKSSAPYGMKLAAAALELAMKVLDARIYGSPRPSILSRSFDMFDEISESDSFYPFIDQWRIDEFPWEKYLAMPTVADEILNAYKR